MRFSDFVEGIGAFVSAAQDEYWPEQERDQLDALLQRPDGKTSLVYFGGNGGYWRVRFDKDARGGLRDRVCYKNEPDLDPQRGSTVRFRALPHPRPESNLFGAMYEGWQLVMFPMVVADASHWLFEGTGLTRGTLLQGLLGYEYDKDFPELPGAPEDLHVRATSASARCCPAPIPRPRASSPWRARGSSGRTSALETWRTSSRPRGSPPM